SNTFEKQSYTRFAYIESVNKFINEYETSGRKKKKMFYIASKVVAISSAIISVLLPLAFYFFPIWVPLCIGLPAFFGCAIAYSLLEKQLDGFRARNRFVPALQSMLQNQSAHSLHPLGEWDLPATDDRLKSDLLAVKELEKKHPESASQIEKLAGCRSG